MKLLGTKHPNALGRPHRETFPEVLETVGPMIESVMTTGTPIWEPEQLLVLEREGYLEECYFTLSYSPVQDDTGRIAGMLCICSETTQKVLGERRLRLLRDLASRASEARTVEVACRDITVAIANQPLDVPFALIYLREPDGTSLALRGAVGLAPDTASSPLAVNLSDPSTCPWSLAQAASGETILVEELEACHGQLPGGPWPDPARKALVLPLPSSNQGPPVGVLVAGISPRRALDEGYRSFFELLAAQVATVIANARAYEEERRRAEMLAELDRAKTAFFSNISHEFRTPLTLMLGPTEELLAMKDALPHAACEQVALIHRNGLRLLKLVNTLLEFSCLEAGRLQVRYEPTDLARLTTDLAGVFRSAIERAGLSFVVDCPPLREPVWVDRDMWEKIVLNLLSNAFKFTFNGAITVRLTRKEGYAELAVQDTGTGIAPEELPHLFERFHRVTGAQGRTHEGSGIGLALVQELVKLHGGQVQVTSVLGEGSTFTVKLPLSTAHLPLERLNARRTQASTGFGASPYVEEALRWLPQAPTTVSPDLSVEPLHPGGENAIAIPSQLTRRILFADDNADMRDYVHRLLGSHYEVEVVADGNTALARVQQWLPDLVLTDVMMPGLDGFQLLKALRADAATCQIPVILLSARSGEEATIEGLEAGADDYLSKPFRARELLARVRTHLELSALRREAISQEQRLKASQIARMAAEQARREAEAANRLKDEFLATVSHELKTPLNAILGWAQMLKGRRLDSTTAARALETIERNARNQNRIIEDILDISRMRSGKLNLQLGPVELVPTLASALENARLDARSKGIELTSQVELQAGVILGDATRLQQVLANLLNNAIKFTPSGGRVAVRLERVGSEVAITISDTGQGIAPEVMPFIFERFRQADGSTTRQHGGIGLGLAIVRHLVEIMGGRVEAQSAGVGQGAVFTVTLPLAHSSRLTAPPRASVLDPESSLDPLAGILTGIRVLVVDDEADARFLVSSMLKSYGAEVLAVPNASEALESLETWKPNVLLSDIGMPLEDGYSLIRKVRALDAQRGGRIPAAALTAYTRSEERTRALQAGYQLHLPKPVEAIELAVVVANLTGRVI